MILYFVSDLSASMPQNYILNDLISRVRLSPVQQAIAIVELSKTIVKRSPPIFESMRSETGYLDLNQEVSPDDLHSREGPSRSGMVIDLSVFATEKGGLIFVTKERNAPLRFRPLSVNWKSILCENHFLEVKQ